MNLSSLDNLKIKKQARLSSSHTHLQMLNILNVSGVFTNGVRYSVKHKRIQKRGRFYANRIVLLSSTKNEVLKRRVHCTVLEF